MDEKFLSEGIAFLLIINMFMVLLFYYLTHREISILKSQIVWLEKRLKLDRLKP